VGKHKTVTQMVTAILALLLLAIDPSLPAGRTLLDVAVIVTALITAVSGLYYLAKNYPLIVSHVRRP
jgi:phosphatidylglycerophosphate synthase